ncbi:MAG: hypothetical protein LKF36_16080 [Lactobacillus sp.]|nr:hypothetical protein [Lactobacillus sp.]
MSKRKRRRRFTNIGEYISADELRTYIEHADKGNLDFLTALIATRRQDILAKEGAMEFPIYQRLEKKLDAIETKIKTVIKVENGVDVGTSNELTPSFLYGYFQDYPTDAYFEAYSQWQKTIKDLNQLQDKIGAIIAVREKIRKAGFDIVKTRFSQRSLSTYLDIPASQANAFNVVFGRRYDMSRLQALIWRDPSKISPEQTFSVRISDHINDTFYNQSMGQRQSYRQADVNIYI